MIGQWRWELTKLVSESRIFNNCQGSRKSWIITVERGWNGADDIGFESEGRGKCKGSPRNEMSSCLSTLLTRSFPQFPLQPSPYIQFNLLYPCSLLDVVRQLLFPESLPLVTGLTLDFTDCVTGRTISMAWACRQKRKRMMECIQA